MVQTTIDGYYPYWNDHPDSQSSLPTSDGDSASIGTDSVFSMDSLNDPSAAGMSSLPMSQTIPAWKHSNSWIRWPSLLWRFYLRNNLVMFGFCSVAIVSELAQWGSVIVFILNLVALIPLSYTLGLASEELCYGYGPLTHKFVHALGGNTLVTVIGVISVIAEEGSLGLDSLLGSIVLNSLLMHGLAALISGFRQPESRIPDQSSSAIILIAVAALAISTTFVLDMVMIEPGNSAGQPIETLSRATAVILLTLYGISWWFRARSVGEFFENPHDDQSEASASTSDTITPTIPDYSPKSAGASIITALPLAAICSLNIVSNNQETAKIVHVPVAFLAFVVVPLGTNATDLAIACLRAQSDTFNATLITMESQIQIACFSLPLTIIVGWVTGYSATLLARSLDIVALDLGVFVSNYTTATSRVDYLKGAQCIGMYVILVLSFLTLSKTSG